MNEVIVNNENKQNINTDIESLPANSSWWTFFVNAFFGKNYCRFKGRASRKEFLGVSFLWFSFSFFIDLSLLIIMMATGKDVSLIETLVAIYAILPQLSVSARRFHDINMSAWWLLIFPAMTLCVLLPQGLNFLVCALFAIPFMFLPFFKGDRKDNKYGKTIYSNAQ